MKFVSRVKRLKYAEATEAGTCELELTEQEEYMEEKKISVVFMKNANMDEEAASKLLQQSMNYADTKLQLPRKYEKVEIVFFDGLKIRENKRKITELEDDLDDHKDNELKLMDENDQLKKKIEEMEKPKIEGISVFGCIKQFAGRVFLRGRRRLQ